MLVRLAIRQGLQQSETRHCQFHFGLCIITTREVMHLFTTPQQLKPTHMKEMWSANDAPAYAAKTGISQSGSEIV